MTYHVPAFWLFGSRHTAPAARQRPPADLGLHRYMLEVYEYVACGLALTGLAAYFVTYSGFHAAMMELTPPFLLPFVWILLLAPLALVMLLWLSIDDMSLWPRRSRAGYARRSPALCLAVFPTSISGRASRLPSSPPLGCLPQ